MAILGSIIKGVIDVKDTLTPQPDHIKSQQKVLTNLLEEAKDTAFGKYYNFNTILSSENVQEAFAVTIPFFDYHKIDKEWRYRLHKGETDITWRGNPSHFALSSGITGKTSKRIPVCTDMITHLRR